MSRKPKSPRVASAETLARLAQTLRSIGADALEPAAAVLLLPLSVAILAAPRVILLQALRLIAGGTAGFDYAPVGMVILRWVVINRINKVADPLALWTMAQGGFAVPPTARSTPVADAVAQALPQAASVPQAAPVLPASVPSPSLPQDVDAPVAPVAPMSGGSVPPAVAPAPVVESVPGDMPVIDAEAQSEALDVNAAPLGLSPAQRRHPEWNWQPASKVFGVRGLKGNVPVWPKQGQPGAHPRCPKVNPIWAWHKDHLQWLVMAANESPAKGCWFWGERGAGKSKFAAQFAAMTGRPFFAVTFTALMEPMEFLGSDTAKNGSTVWRDGTILLGLKEPIPSVIMFDEMSYGQSSYISGPINEIVDPQCSYMVPATWDRVDFSDGHLFIAADNTNGTGDASGMFVNTNVINRATLDRFSFNRRFTRLPKGQELQMLMDNAECSRAIAEKVWTMLDTLRKKVDSCDLKDPPSVREAVAMCSALRSGYVSEKDAFETCFVGKYPDEAQETMRVAFTAVFAATPGVDLP